MSFEVGVIQVRPEVPGKETSKEVPKTQHSQPSAISVQQAVMCRLSG